MRLRIIAPNGTTSELVVTAAIVRVGRDPACEVHFDAAVYPKVSAEHAQIERTAGGLVLTHLSRSNKTLLNETPVEGSVPLKAGDRIHLGFSGPMVEVVSAQALASASVPKVEPADDYAKTQQAAPQHLALLRGSLGARRMEVG
jgi:pSer/pThr/pTyr-binding forkhead associated (FHA) protein